ncbi:MAG: GNAT family N-acetyltransferase [Rufibacter sp.]
MIQLLRHHQIDQEKWGDCLRHAEAPLAYAHFWYLEVVTQGNWQALVEVQGQEYVSLFPVPVKSFLGQRRVYQPFFTQQLGLFLTAKSQERELAKYMEILSGEFTHIQLQMPHFSAAPNALNKNWRYRSRPNYELLLNQPYAQLYQNYSLNLRRNLKKAQAAQLEVTPAQDIQPLLHLFRQGKGQELRELRVRHYQLLAQLYAQAKQQGVGYLWEVRQNQELLAAAFLVEEPTRTIFLFGASSAAGKKQNAMALLLDHALRRHAETPGIFDFEGSEVPGVAKFYASFGAKPVPYVSLNLKPQPSSPFPWILHAFTSLRKRPR